MSLTLFVVQILMAFAKLRSTGCTSVNLFRIQILRIPSAFELIKLEILLWVARKIFFSQKFSLIKEAPFKKVSC